MMKKIAIVLLFILSVGNMPLAYAETLQDVEAQITKVSTDLNYVMLNSSKNPYTVKSEIVKNMDELITLENKAQVLRKQALNSLSPNTREYYDAAYKIKESESKILNYTHQKNVLTNPSKAMTNDEYVKKQKQLSDEMLAIQAEGRKYKYSATTVSSSTQSTTCDSLCQQMKSLKKTQQKIDNYLNRNSTYTKNNYGSGTMNNTNGTTIYSETIYKK